MTGKKCPLYFVEHEDAWEQFHKDLDTYIEENGVYGYLNDKLERITDLQVFTTERLHQIIQYQTMNSVLVEQIQLIFDSINTNIALGIEYKNLDQSIKKYMTDHKSPLLLENINKTCIDGNDGNISFSDSLKMEMVRCRGSAMCSIIE